MSTTAPLIVSANKIIVGWKFLSCKTTFILKMNLIIIFSGLNNSVFSGSESDKMDSPSILTGLLDYY